MTKYRALFACAVALPLFATQAAAESWLHQPQVRDAFDNPGFSPLRGYDPPYAASATALPGTTNIPDASAEHLAEQRHPLVLGLLAA